MSQSKNRTVLQFTTIATMSQQKPKKDKFIATFGIKNDKSRGILIQTLKVCEDVYLFKYQDQPLSRHCLQLQNIIQSANVKRTRQILVDATPFICEYYHKADDSIRFKGTKLISTKKQMENVRNMKINKEIGQLKRHQTVAQKKEEKIAEHNRKLKEKLDCEERIFQMERARRINELYGFEPSNNPTDDDGTDNEMQL